MTRLFAVLTWLVLAPINTWACEGDDHGHAASSSSRDRQAVRACAEYSAEEVERLRAKIYNEALAAEKEGRGKDAIRLYTQAARSGSAQAALRVAQIYQTGAPGVPTNPGESKKWYRAARVLGADVDERRTR